MIPQNIDAHTMGSVLGVDDFEIKRAYGVEHFGISEGKWGIKMFIPPMVDIDIFWDHPLHYNKRRAHRKHALAR